MEKLNREFTSIQLKNSKDRNINAIMESISTKQKSSIFKPKYALAFGMFVVAIIAVILIDFGNNPNTIPNPGDNVIDNNDNNSTNVIVLNDATTETLVELSYMSASLMADSFSLSNNNLLKLTQPVKKTSIEADIDEVNAYFDMLKVFLEDNPFGNDIVVEDLIDQDYQSKISFTSDGNSFEFYINIIEEDIEGILYIEDTMYTVTGKQVIEETESKLQLKAINGTDYVEIEHIFNSSDLEVTEKYNVETSINNVITEKNIKVSIEDGSYKVTIEDLSSKYNLKKNTEDDQGKYKLDYTIDGEKGKASIYEDVDELNNPVYRYEIREGNLTATILVPRTTVPTVEPQKSNPNNFDEIVSSL